jgi:hypothetical protein
MQNRRNALLVLAGLALFLLAGCGGGSAPPAQTSTSSFVLSQAGSVAFLTWTTQSGSGLLTGSYTATVPDSQNTRTASVTGQQPDASDVLLQIEAIGELSGTMQGTMMQTRGTGGTLTWYAATSHQYAEIQAAYWSSLKVQGDLDTLLTVEGTPPNDSYSGYYQAAVMQAQGRVQDEQASLTYIQQQQDAMTRCMALSEFTANFPPANQDQELQLPYALGSDQGPQAVVDRSTLSRAITQLATDFQAAQGNPLPQISGLSFAWKVDAGPQLAQARQQLDGLRQTILTVAPQFPPLEQQAAQIQSQEAAIQHQHQCFG